MLIVCPQCRRKTEIEHVERGRRVECDCGLKFELDDRTVLNDYSQVDDPPPQMIGPYPVTRFIGRGGMGTVYKGTHPKLGIPVAIKVLLREYACDPSLRERFLQSAKICAKMSHPNVVRVYDFGFDKDDMPYLVLEYIGGGTMFDQLARSGPLNPRYVAEVGISVSCAMSEAEKFGIVHRDIKPDNIMLDKEGVCKLSDLGLAKIDPRRNNIRSQVNYHAETTRTGGLGTPDYMAPEQALDAKHCDIRADIYSLGISMYQLITDKLPYDTNDPEKLAHLRMERPPTPPHEYCPDLSPVLENIILRCIMINPNNRYQTPEEVRADLEAYLSGNPLPSEGRRTEEIPLDGVTSDAQSAVSATSESESPLLAQQKKRIRILMFVLLIVSLLCILVWLTHLLMAAPPERDAETIPAQGAAELLDR